MLVNDLDMLLPKLKGPDDGGDNLIRQESRNLCKTNTNLCECKSRNLCKCKLCKTNTNMCKCKKTGTEDKEDKTGTEKTNTNLCECKSRNLCKCKRCKTNTNMCKCDLLKKTGTEDKEDKTGTETVEDNTKEVNKTDNKFEDKTEDKTEDNKVEDKTEDNKVEDKVNVEDKTEDKETVNVNDANDNKVEDKNTVNNKDAKSRGYCTLVDMDCCQEPSTKDVRKDSENDLIEVFRKKRYQVNHIANPNRQLLLQRLNGIARMNHSQYDSFVLVIRCHGNFNRILCQDDEELAMSEILEIFSKQNSPTLANKPKLIFIQACREFNYDPQSSNDGMEILQEGEFFISIAVVQGCISRSASIAGEHFVQALEKAGEENNSDGFDGSFEEFLECEKENLREMTLSDGTMSHSQIYSVSTLFEEFQF